MRQSAEPWHDVPAPLCRWWGWEPRLPSLDEKSDQT